MEELRKRFEFNSISVKIQSGNKLAEKISSTLSTTVPLSSSKQQTPELKLLWELCGDLDLAVSSTCSSILVSMVKRGLADLDFVLQGFLNLVPTAKNLSGICCAVCDILILQLVALLEKTGEYNCPYAIRDPPHPLVTIVTSRPDCWIVLQQQISRLLNFQDERISANVLDLLHPLLQFILLEPAQSAQFLPLRMGLVPSLLNASDHTGQLRHKVETRLVHILTKCQLHTSQNLSEFSHHVTCLLHQFMGQQQEVTSDQKETTNNLVSMVINFCQVALHQGFDVSHLLSLLLKLVDIFPECLSYASYLDLVTLVNVLSPQHVLPVVKLVQLWLKMNGGKYLVLDNMIVLPMIQVVTLPTVAKDMMDSVHQSLATNILTMITDCPKVTHHQNQFSESKSTKFQNLTPESSTNAAFTKLAMIFSESSDRAQIWLNDIQSVLNDCDHVPLHVTCMVTSLIILTKEQHILDTALNVLVKISRVDPAQAPGMLPLLLHQINREEDPDRKLALLHAFPKTVTHKLAIGPALHSIQILAANPELKAVSMVLMSTLWQQQNRCFQYLQQIIVDNTRGKPCPETGVDEIMIAKAKCIRDVCEHRPEQHGEDILSPLSDLINKCTAEQDAEVVSLALEGLYFLCEAEVIDIVTAWATLSTKLLKDKRHLVSAAVCRLLALTPQLEAEGDEFVHFKHDVLKILWQYTQSKNTHIACAAFKALAKFTRKVFLLSHFPTKVTEGMIKEKEDSFLDSLLEEAGGGEPPQEEEPQDIPGQCYTKLLKSLPHDVLKEYEVFLRAVVREEVEAIPRGIHHSAKRQQLSSSNQNKAVAAIPAFLQAEFDRNKNPGVRPSLAVGVLYSYDPPVSTGKDGKPRTHQIIQLGRSYQQTLYNLIHEVPMQTGDWHQALSLPHAWLAFMDKCFNAHMEGHRLELQQQLDRGKVHDPDENMFRQQTSWLWTRDKLTDLIKSTSSGSPTAQANSLCALGGLAVAVSKHVSSLDHDQLTLAETATEHRSHPHWLSVVMETMLCILDPKYLTNAELLQLCQLRTGQDRHPSATLARCGAGLALSFMVPILMTTNADTIYLLLDALTLGLPGACSENAEKPVLLFYHSLTLGLVLARLFEEHFADTAGTQGMVAVWKGLDALEKSCMSNENNRLGGYLGLSVCLVAMCSDNKTDARVHVTTLQEQLTVAMETTPVTDSAFEGTCLCLAALAGTCYLCNIIGQDVVDQVVAKIYQIHCQNTQMPGVALSLGVICNLILQASHPTVGNLTIKLFGSWLGALSETSLPTLQRLSYLKGALALSGSENSLYNISEGTTSSQSGISISDITKATQQLVRDGSDLGLQSACSWQLGQLSMSAMAGGQSRLSVPMTYHYLPETSIVRALVDILLEAGKQGSEAVAEEHLASTLRVLGDGPSQPLPPLNWPGVLSPIIRMVYKEIEMLSLKLAVRQSAVSPSAGLLLASWLVPPLWDTLKLESHIALLDSLPRLITSVPMSKLKEFLEDGFIRPFVTLTSQDQSEVEVSCMHQCSSALKGLLGALQVPDPPNMITKLLYQTTQTLHGHMPKYLDLELYTAFCKCLAELPDDLVNQIIAKDFDDLELYSKGLYVRCYLVSHGNQPLTLINNAVEAFMCKTESNARQCLWYLTHCFYGVHISKADCCSVAQCQTWLLELMGYIRNIATGVVPVVDLKISQVVDFLLLVFSSAVSSWSSCASSQLSLAPVQLGSGSQEVTKSRSQDDCPCNPLVGTGEESIMPLLKTNLPLALNQLVNKEHWRQISSKVIDWLMALHQSPSLEQTQSTQHWIKDCLYALRHNSEMKKMSVWSKAFSLS